MGEQSTPTCSAKTPLGKEMTGSELNVNRQWKGEQPSQDEHDLDEAGMIRRQVEHYFTDENLAQDTFLCFKMRGNENRPVEISIIHAFKKMQRFQSCSQITDALRSSETLDVVVDHGKDCIVRKIPYIRHGNEATRPPSVTPKQKKHKATGFEDYWTDVPITMQEHEVDQDLYDTTQNSFVERIEIAIQRFKAKRRFRPRASNIWMKFMKYGGIETGQSQFSGGLDQESLEDKSAAEIARLKATEFVGDDKFELGPDNKWSVDFEGVAKGFLSTYILELFTFDNQVAVTECVQILRSFYQYLLYHKVCPEYTQSITAALRICDLAEDQLLDCQRAPTKFPGAFNKASSIVSGGRNLASVATESDWTSEDDGAASPELSMIQARQVFACGLTSYGEATLGKPITNQDIYNQKIVAIEEAGFEITALFSPPAKVEELYANHFEGTGSPVGKIFCKPWRAPSFQQYDAPPSFIKEPRPARYEFWVEEAILDGCFVGMKFQAEVCTVTSGLSFIERVETAFPSYHLILENELLCPPDPSQKWRTPRWITREENLERARRREGSEIEALHERLSETANSSDKNNENVQAE